MKSNIFILKSGSLLCFGYNVIVSFAQVKLGNTFHWYKTIINCFMKRGKVIFTYRSYYKIMQQLKVHGWKIRIQASALVYFKPTKYKKETNKLEKGKTLPEADITDINVKHIFNSFKPVLKPGRGVLMPFSSSSKCIKQ